MYFKVTNQLLIRFCALLKYLMELRELNTAVYTHTVRMCKIRLGRKLCTLLSLNSIYSLKFFAFWRDSPQWARASSFTRFLDHTQRRTTVGRTPLDEWSARRRDLYLTTHDTHNRQISMPTLGFEPTISAGERPQTYALDRAVTGTGIFMKLVTLINMF